MESIAMIMLDLQAVRCILMMSSDSVVQMSVNSDSSLSCFDIEPGTGPVLPSGMGQGGDLFGHFSDCMVEVGVQNKTNPVWLHHQIFVISCNYWIDINRLADPNDSLLGKVVNDLAWRKSW